MRGTFLKRLKWSSNVFSFEVPALILQNNTIDDAPYVTNKSDALVTWYSVRH